MATDLLPADLEEESPRRDFPRRSEQPTTFRRTLENVLGPLASLKLTVGLFSFAIILVFVGTLAQAHHDVWWVMHNYFRSFFAWIEFQVLFPPAWFPNAQNISGGIWFPGGFLIGSLMAINLLAAHGLRFKVQAKGMRLWSGVGVIGLGCLLTWLIIDAGPGKDGLQATMPFSWKTIWQLFLLGLALSCVGIAGSLFVIKPERKAERKILVGVGSLLLLLLAVLLFVVDASSMNSDAMLSSMRILWQVIEGGFAALVLLAGCIMVFRKRAGIVLLHAGVLLLMANELVVDALHKETAMMIREGETANYAYDLRTFELAIIDPKYSETEDDVVVVPEQLIHESLGTEKPIAASPLLPFDVAVKKLYENAEVVDAKQGEASIADAGLGKTKTLAPQRPITGTDAEKINLPGGYFEFFEKGTDKSLGTYLLAITADDQTVDVGDKQYRVALRFERDYKPYSIHLYDVERENYPGTLTPKSYSSEFQIVDAAAGVDRRAKVRMNEPLRYGGETFYQSGNPTPNITVLSVVSNFGWMIPYMACMIVGVGLLAQFALVLTRFIRRRENPLARTLQSQATMRASRSLFAQWLPAAMAVLAVGMLAYAAIPRRTIVNKMDLTAFGELPIMSNGRIQPVDSLARNTLRMISTREVYVDANDNHPSAIKKLLGLDQTQPAVRWLLDVIARPDVAKQHRVFRVENPDVLAVLKLDRRKLFRYSLNELAENGKAFDDEMRRVHEQDDAGQTVFAKKLVELSNRLSLYDMIGSAFMHRPLPSLDELKAEPDKIEEKLQGITRALQAIPQFEKALAQRTVPLAIPVLDPESPTKGNEALAWEPYPLAWLKAYQPQMKNLLLPDEKKVGINPAVVAWESIIDAYKAQDAEKFNQAVSVYAQLVAHLSPTQLSDANPKFESWFNAWGAFSLCQWLYFVAFCLGAFAWLGWSETLNRTAFWLIVVVFVGYSLSLCFRMYISGRPPVTNLYSSAIFIGWAGVLAGLIIESVYRLGFGNILASASGFATLIIADKLSLVYDSQTRGDMVGVMQAVLDTQFWLATHVTCITLGYTATLVAGLLGLIYVVRGLFTPSLTADEGKNLARMMYGTVCFGIFFSFIGTVLGGLWADDSWGRFWGWDPKENGALIIVLWNALILHARWDGLVKDRGLALLAIGGNIVTSWSWFGVNQLGVGLHSYGFTEGVLVALGVFCLSQFAMIAIGLLPQRYWMSHRQLAA